MAKSMYAAISGTTKKIKKNYAVVGGVTRKIKKMYAVVDGKTRLIFSGGELVAADPITASVSLPSGGASTSFGSYGLMSHGSTTDYEDNTIYCTTIYGFTSSLTQFARNTNGQTSGVYSAAALNDNSYAFFVCGGYASSNVNCISSTLTLSSYNHTNRNSMSAGSVGNYVVYGGGKRTFNGTTSSYNEARAVNNTLSVTTLTNFTTVRGNATPASIGNYILFAGGTQGTSTSGLNTIELYNSSLTKGSAPELHTGYAVTQGRCDMAGVTFAGYALFVGGDNGYSGGDSTEEDYWMCGGGTKSAIGYNSSLTRTLFFDFLQEKRYRSQAVVLGDNLIVAGGQGPSYLSSVEVFDQSLTRTIGTPLSKNRANCMAATIDNSIAIFAGGGNTIDIYKIE